MDARNFTGVVFTPVFTNGHHCAHSRRRDGPDRIKSRKLRAMKQVDRIGDFSTAIDADEAQRAADRATGSLWRRNTRRAEPIVEKLRAEFRKDGRPSNRAQLPRAFFAPLDPLRVEGALDLLDQSECCARLDNLMNAIAALVKAEAQRFPDEVGHVAGSHSLRGRQPRNRRLCDLAWKARDAVSGGVAFCKKLISPRKSRGRKCGLRRNAQPPRPAFSPQRHCIAGSETSREIAPRPRTETTNMPSAAFS